MSLREKKKKSTRRSILAAARSLFFTGGYEATSMGMIAEESGGGRGDHLQLFLFEGTCHGGDKQGGYRQRHGAS